MNYVLMPIAHGVELKNINSDYATPLIDGIRKNLTEQEKNYLIPLPYNYTASTNARQILMFMATDYGLGNQELRKLKHTIGSDVTWSFILAKDGKECFYTDFVQGIKNLLNKGVTDYNAARIMCVGHSQGTQLFYSYFFDSDFEIDCFASLGSPISMNSGAWPDFGRVPKNLKCWLNFYNDMDFVSSKLQGAHLSKEIADFVVDYKVPLGWNPIYHIPFMKMQLLAGLLAHIMYWKSDYVAKILAEKVKELIYQPDLPSQKPA